MSEHAREDVRGFVSRVNDSSVPYADGITEQDEQRVYVCLIKETFGNATIPLFATVVNSALVAWVLSWVIEPIVPLAWAGILWALSLWRLLELNRFNAVADLDYQAAKKWGKRFELEMLPVGLLWGGSVLMLGHDAGLSYQVFLAFVLAGMSAGAVAAFSTIPRVAYAYIIPALAPLGAMLLFAGDPLHLAMSLMVILYLAAMTLLVQRSHHSLLRAQRLRYQNNYLLDYYRETSSNLESLYDSLKLESNRAQQNLRDLQTRDRQVKNLLASVPVLMLAIDEHGRIMAIEGQQEFFGASILRPGDNFIKRAEHMPGAEPLIERALNGEAASAIIPLDYQSVEMHVWPNNADSTDYSVTVILMDVSREQEIDRKKRQFVNAMSHELRTPLTSVYGAVKLLVEGGLQTKPKDARDLATIALRSCEQLMRVSEDAILLAETGSEKRRSSFKDVDVMPILHSIVTQFTNDARAKNINIAVKQSSACIVAKTEEKLLRRVIEAVISNGVKFSPDGGELLIEIDDSRLDEIRFVRISVSDNGPGIPAEKRAEVFEHFVQLSSMDDRQGYGTGLGLSIVKEAVHVMGGKVSVFDVQPCGTKIVLEIPMAEGQ